MPSLLYPDYKRTKQKEQRGLCHAHGEAAAEMFVLSDAYKFKEDANEIGEDSGKSRRNY